MKETGQQWLKRTRILAGFPKQENLAAAIGASRGAVGNWETTGRPSLKNVPALAGALGVSAQEIIDRFEIEAGEGVPTAAVPSWAHDLMVKVDRQTALLQSILEALTDATRPAAPALPSPGNSSVLRAEALRRQELAQRSRQERQRQEVEG